ncbi:sulfotransferase family protein, partial [Thioalkalivibrio sp.]|uniref:sulfotransferase family protein n=1 Tax=Thioalkalivibrio sp. TaxID=2093813 RepID=UPI0012D5AFB4
PSAKFILTHRSPERWANSYSSTIQKLIAGRDQAPPEMQEWLEMAHRVVTRTGFPDTLDQAGLIDAFVAHVESVKQAVPAAQLLVYQVKEGWGPLCDFLQVSPPDGAFPHTNKHEEFWDLVGGAR